MPFNRQHPGATRHSNQDCKTLTDKVSGSPNVQEGSVIKIATMEGCFVGLGFGQKERLTQNLMK